MPSKVTDVQREAILAMLAKGLDRATIADQTGVTVGQVSAIAAHLTMGTYALHEPEVTVTELADVDKSSVGTFSEPILAMGPSSSLTPVFLGLNAESNEDVYWNPDPAKGTANPHMLVLGESGFGKTYTIAALLTELARQKVISIVFDYGQGFARESAPPEFMERAKPEEIEASRDGIAINPLEIFPSDIHGPLNVAQRIADTFVRVYPKLGMQQHAVLRQAVINAFARVGIVAESRESWNDPIPTFAAIQKELSNIASGSSNPTAKAASAAASHVSTIFIFNTFRQSGQSLAWDRMLSEGGVFVIKLKGLDHSLERIVTEFLLWNLIGFVESLGPGPLRCFVVLDEAHRLSFNTGSPAEKLLREGRKFGLGLILASQHPEDFSPVAFGNTATKLIFQVADDNGSISRQLHKKLRNSDSLSRIAGLITRLPRGCAYYVSENVGRVVRIASFEERQNRSQE